MGIIVETQKTTLFGALLRYWDGRVYIEEEAPFNYDVIRGVYADSGSCKIGLVDWNKDFSHFSNHPNFLSNIVYLGDFRNQEVTDSITGQPKTFQIPTSVTFHSTNQSSHFSIYASTTEDYSKGLTSRTGLEGSYSFFSGSLSIDYSSGETSSLANSFTRIQHFVSLYNLILPPLTTFKRLLKDDVVQDIDNLSPNELYLEYGTHFLNSLTVGGHAAFTSSTDTRKYTSKTSVEVAALMSYKAIVGSITAEEKVKYQEAMNSFSSSSSTRVLTTGGNPSYADENFPKHVKDWANSILDYPAMQDFGPNPAFLPIWELASTPDRRKALQDALHIYLTQHNKDLNIPPPYLTTSDAVFSVYLAGWRIAKNLLVDFKQLPADDHRYFSGPLISYSSGGSVPRGPVVVPYITGAVADVKRWEVLCTSYWSNKSGLRIWRGFGPTPDYVLLCDFALEYHTSSPGDDPTPPADKIKNLKTVHISCLKPATYTNPHQVIYSNPPMDLWEISEGGDYSSGFWRAGSAGGDGPSPPAYVLNPEYITVAPA